MKCIIQPWKSREELTAMDSLPNGVIICCECGCFCLCHSQPNDIKSSDKELVQGYLHSHEELHHLVAHFETFDLFRRNVVLLHGNKLSRILDTLEDHVVVWLDVHSEVAVLVGFTLCKSEKQKTLWKSILIIICMIQCLWQM